jgi:hypothetical protein
MRFLVVTVCVLSTCIFTRTALAQYGGQTPIGQAEAEAQAAQGRADDAGTHLTIVVNGLRRTFEASPEYTAAKKVLTTATTRRDAEQSEVLDQLHGTEEYQAAYKSLDDAHKAVETARSDGDPAEIANASLNAIKAKRALEQMDAQALNGDTQYQADEKRFTAANTAMQKLDAKFATSITSNPDWQKAKADVDKANGEVAAANQTLAALEAEQSDHTSQLPEHEGGQHVR